MDESIAGPLIVYSLVAAFVLLVALLSLEGSSWRDRRSASRAALLCWAWPLLLVWALVMGIRSLWIEAAWGERK